MTTANVGLTRLTRPLPAWKAVTTSSGADVGEARERGHDGHRHGGQPG